MEEDHAKESLFKDQQINRIDLSGDAINCRGHYEYGTYADKCTRKEGHRHSSHSLDFTINESVR
jgi:hypothetical protein